MLSNFFQKKPLQIQTVTAFAPTNIALIKYWGKRDKVLNLPVTSSLSVTLPDHGTTTQLTVINESADKIILNDKTISSESPVYQKIKSFIDIFRYDNECFLVETKNNIPTAAGLASSASGFAALALALDQVYRLNLSLTHLSAIARLGSGSACRSLWSGFVYWEKGKKTNGTDSHGIPLEETWPGLCMGLNLIQASEKPISSRDAMNITTETSPFYQVWPAFVAQDLQDIKKVIRNKDFENFGRIVERNAIAMHATMQTAWPSIFYSTPETITEMNKVWSLRKAGTSIYFTQDAGPNLKLMFLKNDKKAIQSYFPNLTVIDCF